VDKLFDVVFAAAFGGWGKSAELLDDLSVFEMNASDVVVKAALFDGGPFDDAIGFGAHGVAHVTLLEDFFGARA